MTKSIGNGHMPSDKQELLRRIGSASDVSSRIAANLELAELYHGLGEDSRTTGFLERAWLLGARDFPLLRRLLSRLLAEGRAHDALDRLREAGMAAIEGDNPHDLARSLILFGETALYNGRRMQDDVLSRAAMRYLQKFQAIPPGQQPNQNSKLRIGYLLFLECEREPILSQVAVDIAEYHNSERVEVTFYSTYSHDEIVTKNPPFAKALDQITRRGHRFVENATGGTSFDRAQRVVQTISADKIDALIQLAQWPYHFMIAAMRPAPVIFGLNATTADTDTSIALDYHLVGLRQALSESLCDGIWVHPAYTAAVLEPASPHPRALFGLEPTSTLLVSSGREWKFEHQCYWDFLAELLAARPNLEFLFVGLTEEDPVKLGVTVPPAVLARSRLLGFRTDFREILAMADLYLDTFPVGGGYAVLESIHRGIGAVLHRADPFQLANFRNNYAPISEISDEPGFALNLEDGQDRITRVLELIDDAGARRRLARLQADAIAKARKDNAGYTAEIEDIIWRICRGG